MTLPEQWLVFRYREKHAEDAVNCCTSLDSASEPWKLSPIPYSWRWTPSPLRCWRCAGGLWVSTFEEFVVGVENLLKCDVQGNRRAPDMCLVSLFSLVKIYYKHHVSYQWVVTPSWCVMGCLSSVLGRSWDLWWPWKLTERTPERTVCVKASILQTVSLSFCPLPLIPSLGASAKMHCPPHRFFYEDRAEKQTRAYVWNPDNRKADCAGRKSNTI